MSLKTTNFHNNHLAHNAKMVSFAGFQMPIQYPGGIIHEHKVVRTGVGVFDVSHMGEFELRGPQALELIQKITVNDASKLVPGKAQYSAMCYDDGGIVDDLLVYHCGDYYMLVVNGACLDKDWDWVTSQAGGMDVEAKNVSDEFNLLAVQGPKSLATVAKLTSTDVETIPYYGFVMGTVDGVETIISRTGYTGEIGLELYFRGAENATIIWNSLMTAGQEFGIEPVGLGARDTLRLEKGYCLYGNDIDATTNTIEANLGWITKLAKGEFNGRSVIATTKEAGPTRQLVGFTMQTDRLIPRQGYELRSGQDVIGKVTSGNFSPNLEVGIGMGYVARQYAAPGTQIDVAARNTTFPAIVTKVPFL